MIRKRNELFRCQYKIKESVTWNLLTPPTNWHSSVSWFNILSLIPFCKKNVPYYQTLSVSRICSGNGTFDQRCYDLEKRLKERSYGERMVRTEILEARGESRDRLLEGVNTLTSESKLTFNIAYYTAFQNVRSILQKLKILLAPDKELKKVFAEITIVGFCNVKSV